MKKIFLRSFMLFAALASTSMSILAADMVSPTWYTTSKAPDGTTSSDAKGFLNGQTQVYYWNGSAKMTEGVTSVASNGNYLFIARGYTNLNRISLTMGSGAYANPFTLEPGGGTHPLSYIASWGDKVLGFSYSNPVKIYEFAKTVPNTANASFSPQFLGEVPLGDQYAAGEIVGISKVNGKYRVAFGLHDRSEIKYIEGDDNTLNLTPITINLTKDGAPYTIPSNDKIRSRVQVKFTDNGDFFITTNYATPKYFNAQGVYQGEFETKLFDYKTYGATSDLFTYGGRNYIAVVAAESNNHKASIYIIDWTDGIANAKTVAVCDPQYAQGATTNENGMFKTSISSRLTDNHLELWMSQPTFGIAYFKYDLPKQVEVPATAATNLTIANVRWDGTGQKARLTWTSGSNVAKYTIAYAENAESADWTYVNQNISPSVSDVTIDLPMSLGYAPLYRLQSIGNDGKTIGESCYARVYNVSFGSILLQATMQESSTNAQLSWNAPEHGTVKDYNVVLVKHYAYPDGTIRDTEEIITTTTSTSYLYPNYQRSYIENGANVSTSLRIVANMAQSVTISDNNTISKVTSNDAVPHTQGKPYFIDVTTYPGRNIVSLTWKMDNMPSGRAIYTLYRDGIKIYDNLRAASLVDMDLASGTHRYYVVLTVSAYDPATDQYTPIEGFENLRSDEVSVNVSRSADVEQYALEEIYNYPIWSPAEYSEHGNPTNAVKADGIFNNAKVQIETAGAPGDLWRQAAYRNGKWYLAQLTNQTTSNGVGSILSSTSFDDMTKTYTGGIWQVDANDPRSIGTTAIRVSTTYGMENQSVAIDENPSTINLFRRVAEDALGANSPTYPCVFSGANKWGTATVRMRYYAPWDHVSYRNFNENTPSSTISYKESDIRQLTKTGNNSTWWDEYFKYAICAPSLYNSTQYSNVPAPIEQYYRSHYVMAGGNTQNGTGFLLFAPKYTNEVYRLPINTDGTVTRSASRFVAKWDDGSVCDGSGSSENLAIPVIGRPNDFIHFLRGVGVFYVQNGYYRTISDEHTNSDAPAGTTFTFNNEMFFLHGVSTQSNNPGNFRIEIAKGGIAKGDFTDLIPVASYIQTDDASFERQGNSNANWYGTEYSAADECMYIYQYVPGVRFAKYKLYSLKQFPPVQPELKVNVITDVKADNNGDEITHLDATTTWKHPGDYGLSENPTYVLDHYDYELKDHNNKLIDKGTIPNQVNASNFSTFKYNMPWSEKYNKRINHNTVRTTIVPYYRHTGNGQIIRGEGGASIDHNDYPASIGDIKVYTYKHDVNDVWRVEIDFNRADMSDDQYPLPVNNFTIESAPSPTGPWTQITNFLILWRDGRVMNSVQPWDLGKELNTIPGDYVFGVKGETENLKTRYHYATTREAVDYTPYKGKAVFDSQQNSVAHFYTHSNPNNLVYRAVAHYAANNEFIAKHVPTTAVTPRDNGTTGVTDITIGSDSKLNVYPVPATTTITVDAPEFIKQVRIVSLSGATVLSVQGNDLPSQTLDVSSLPTGMYMIIVNNLQPARMIKK